MITWVYDEMGRAAAILDDYCIRDSAGAAVAWVFGVSVFCLKGNHIGWFEAGLLFDIENKLLGFLPEGEVLIADCPPREAAPAMPPFPKRPHVPGLRGRLPRPSGSGWSSQTLAAYLAVPTPIAPGAAQAPHGIDIIERQ